MNEVTDLFYALFGGTFLSAGVSAFMSEWNNAAGFACLAMVPLSVALALSIPSDRRH